MSFSVIYKGSFLNAESDISNADNQKQVDVYISDTESDEVDTPDYIDLEMTDNPLVISNENNDESKHNVINARRAEISFYSSPTIDIENFSGGGDNRFKAEVYYDNVLKFSGFLSLSNVSQDFQPNPNVITIIASDGYSYLKNIPLTDFDGENPTYEHRILTFLCWILSKTGHQFNIVCAFNLREELATPLNSDDSGDTHFFKWIWIHSKTFEDKINNCVNCYEALEIILGDMANITQRNGAHYIRLIDELESSRDDFIFTFDYLGVFISKDQVNYDKSIGVNDLLSWMNDDCRKSMDSAAKEVIEVYQLENAIELLTNYDLSRGEEITTLTLRPESWIQERNITPPILSSTPGYIQIVLTDTLETERYLHIETAVSTQFLYWRCLDKIDVHKGDKFRFSCDWKYDNNPGGSGHYQFGTAMIRLWGDDGTNWFLRATSGYGASDPNTYWIQSNAAWSINANFSYHDGELGTDDLSNWQSSEASAPPCPVTGRVEILLTHNVNTDQRGKSWTSLTFTRQPYIAGTYEKYNVQQWKIAQDIDTITKREGVARVSDTIKRYFKGAFTKVGTPRTLFTGTVGFSGNTISFPLASGYQNWLFTPGKTITTTGTNMDYYTVDSVAYETIPDRTVVTIKENTLATVSESTTIKELTFDLANSFYAGNVFPDGPPDSTYLHPYGHLQISDLWNQYNRTMRKFEGEVDHLSETNDIFDLWNRYFLTDGSISTTGKMFMPLHYESDLFECETSIFLIEVFDENIPKEFPDPEFKYLT